MVVDVCVNMLVIFPRKQVPKPPTKDFEAALFVFDEETRHGSGGVEQKLLLSNFTYCFEESYMN